MLNPRGISKKLSKKDRIDTFSDSFDDLPFYNYSATKHFYYEIQRNSHFIVILTNFFENFI